MSDDATTTPKPSRDSIGNTLFVAIGVSLVCSILVASAAVLLKPQQLRNEEEYRQRIILDVAGLYEPGADIAALYATIKESTTMLASGEQVPVYLVMDGDQIDQVILPVEGAGLWAMMYGFLAVENDGNTARGLQFYDHGETPGLGDQVDKPAWRAQWQGKKLYDADGNPQITIVKGFAPDDSNYEIDGLAGATLTARGVNNLVRHWIGDQGYGPYLKEFSEKETR
ncbi:MAG: NADH:ubiquinone reductase (Na(+)-transporting) subunit C [Desulfobulbaceae bacterium]|nr:NADH:ubiquinone reductase (Na(+)-transporting) subunit C [Desulfobulbaceae bacterium]